MRYDMDEISKKIFKNQNDEKPSYALNQETLKKMKECCEMEKKKYRFNKIPKFAVICCSLCLIVGASIPAYDAIKTYNWKSSVNFEGGEDVTLATDVSCKKIPDAFLDMGETFEINVKELEKKLGFSILDSDRDNDEKVSCSILFNEDGSIGRLDIWRGDYAKCVGFSSMAMDISILNEGADLGYSLSLEKDGGDAWGNKQLIKEIYSENLDTSIVIYNAGGYEDYKGFILAAFEYDNMLYHITADYESVTEEEMIEFVMSLENN